MTLLAVAYLKIVGYSLCAFGIAFLVTFIRFEVESWRAARKRARRGGYLYDQGRDRLPL